MRWSRSKARAIIRARNVKEDKTAVIIWPQKDSSGGQTGRSIRGWIGRKLQMDGDKRGKNPAQMLKLWSDWTENKQGRRRNSKCFQRWQIPTTLVLQQWGINNEDKDKKVSFFCALTTTDASNGSVEWQAPQQIIRWQFAANESCTERPYEENKQTVASNDCVPAGNWKPAAKLDAHRLTNGHRLC